MSSTLKSALTSNTPSDASATGRRSPSHVGRGGAGNITAHPTPGVESGDLSTPTIKNATYTTGRGGTGNMVSNDLSDASKSRAAQDVETPAHHEKEVKGTYHWGRGGEGNMMTIGHGGGNEKTTVPNGHPGKERRGSLQGVVDKGKELLGLKKQAAKHGAEGKAAEREEAVTVEE